MRVAYRKVILIVLFFTCTFFLGQAWQQWVVVAKKSQSSTKKASDLQQIQKQLLKVREAMEEANQAEKNAQREIAQLRKKRKQFQGETARLEMQIAQTTQKMKRLDQQITKIENNLIYTVRELEATRKRLIDREQLFRSRLQLMYTTDPLTYLDVLFNATDFSDFVSRFEGLQTIVAQDEEMIAAHERDEQLIQDKKEDIEAQLAYVDTILVQTTQMQQELATKKNKQQVTIASIEKQEGKLEEITEEQERELMELADEQVRLLREKKKLEAQQRKKPKPKPKVTPYQGGQLRWPLPGYSDISSYFGSRIHPITGRRHIHSGIDIPAPSGTTIVAAASGEVILARWYGGYGNTVIIEHKEGFRTLYAHIVTGGIFVRVGEQVAAGQKIAGVGSTGSSTGHHLHFGVYSNNEATDPLPYLR